MIEPTESEDKAEIDRFVDAMISIRKEIQAIKDNGLSHENNLLRNAPHPAMLAASDEWDFPYTRKEAVYPIGYLKEQKYWVP